MTATKLKMRLADIAAVLFVIAAILYFGHRGVQGGLGLRVGFAAAKEERRLTGDLLALQAERARLENLTHRLSESYLDLDLLDQRARGMLGYVRPDEVVIR